MPGGRPKFEPTPEIIIQVELLASRGLTQDQIARTIGISYQTLNERKKENSEFSEAIKNGQAKGLTVIANALFQSAEGGNITAQIFYLKNRGPKEWMDRKAVEITGHIEHTVGEMSDAELARIAAGGSRGATSTPSGEDKPTQLH